MLVEVKRIDKQEKTVVSSLDVANTFGKRHDNVLKDIRELGCSEEFRLLNFEESKYLNEQKHKQPMYYLTRDGFTLLVMGYTGETAMKFKEAYIKQFNAMERTLQGKLIEREKALRFGNLSQRHYSSLRKMRGCTVMRILLTRTVFTRCYSG